MSPIDFIGVGTIKSGTSLLADMIAQHPQVHWAKRKEVNYFNRYNPDGTKNILSDLPIESYFNFFPKRLPDGHVLGEFSPVYIADTDAISHIRKLFPEVKLLVMFRNPVERAYSHYIYDQQFNAIISGDLSFEQALVEHPYLLEYGLYTQQLQQVYSLFPVDQVKILIFEEFVTDPQTHIASVYEYLGIDSDFVPSVRRTNSSKRIRYSWLHRVIAIPGQWKEKLLCAEGNGATWVRYFLESPLYPKLLAIKHKLLDANSQPITKRPMDEVIREQLMKYYQTDIAHLEDLLGQPLTVWKHE